MPLTRRSLVLALPLLLMTRLPEALAQPEMVEGQAFERQIRLAGADLRLNGTGVRAVAWFKGYAAGLYLRTPALSADQVVAATGPKRLQLRMLQDVPSAEFAKAFRKGIERNAQAGELPQLAARIAAFEARIHALGQVRKGDVVDLDYEPGRGMVLAVNGTLRGEAIAGADLYAALLRSFVGDHPYDKRLRAGLLGAPG